MKNPIPKPLPDATPAQQAEPVWDAYRDDWVHEDDPAPAPDATPAQQEEWRLVPVKPHIDMIDAALDLKHEDGAPHEIVMCDCWSAMVAAAPAPSEPHDLLPGLKRAHDTAMHYSSLSEAIYAIRAEIARIEKERQS